MFGTSPACTQRTVRPSRSAPATTSGSPLRSPGSSSARCTVMPPGLHWFGPRALRSAVHGRSYPHLTYRRMTEGLVAGVQRAARRA